MSTTQQADFMILGPAMASGTKVLDAVHSLYFLPENFKLILTGSENTDQSFFNQVKTLIEHDCLEHRVSFAEDYGDSRAVILPNAGMSRSPKAVSGDTSEALASAILALSRS